MPTGLAIKGSAKGLKGTKGQYTISFVGRGRTDSRLYVAIKGRLWGLWERVPLQAGTPLMGDHCCADSQLRAGEFLN